MASLSYGITIIHSTILQQKILAFAPIGSGTLVKLGILTGNLFDVS